MGNKVFTLDQTTIKKLLTIFKLVIPDFQRNFVWKKSKKEQLLSSLFRGFPIGAVTLYEDENGYYIIDGLQRINTLNQYLSRPETIISFEKFYKKVERDVLEFLDTNDLNDVSRSLKMCIKQWYGRLDSLYEFEKVSVLYTVLKNGNARIAREFENLELVEELLGILKSKIEIAYDDIALIIYRGSKDDLPELFKNINTGSVALSQYEILQSVWRDYLLDRRLVQETFDAFGRELELIQNDYEIRAVKEAGGFDIFKNIIGLNHLLCCREDCDIIFKFSGFKRISNPPEFGEIVKYYDNDSAAFEIYSVILSNAPNKIVKAIDSVYRNQDVEKISIFIDQLNRIIFKAVNLSIKEIKEQEIDLIESKYHALYIIAGIILSEYDIDVDTLTVRHTKRNRQIYQTCVNIKHHKKNKWFVDENRQVGFLNIKIEELLGMKKDVSVGSNKPEHTSFDNTDGILKIRIEDKIISANTVKEFYTKIFLYLSDNFELSGCIPYATGRKRYLVNWKNHHIYGDRFVSPIKVGDFFVETHKSRSGALRDVYNYMKSIGIDVGYVE